MIGHHPRVPLEGRRDSAANSEFDQAFDFCSFSRNAPEIEAFSRQEMNLCKFNVLQRIRQTGAVIRSREYRP